MFGLFKKKNSQPPPFKPAHFENDENPIHQAIIGLSRNSDEQGGRRLLEALVNTPVYLLFAEPEKLETCASIEYRKKAHLVVYTQRDLIQEHQLQSYPNVSELMLPRLHPIFREMEVGLAINPGHAEIGAPVPVGVFKYFPEIIAQQTLKLKEGALHYLPSGEGRYNVLKILKIDDGGIHLRIYSNEYSTPPDSVDETTLVSIGKSRGPGKMLRVGHVPVSRMTFAAWNSTYFQQSIVTEEELEGYRRWKESKGGYFGLQEGEAFSPAPWVHDGNAIHEAIMRIQNGDLSYKPRLYNALIATPLFVLLDDLSNWNTCVLAGAANSKNLAVFTRLDLIPKALIERHGEPVEVKFRQLIVLFRNEQAGMVINPEHFDITYSFTPGEMKSIRATLESLRPVLSEEEVYSSFSEETVPSSVIFPVDDDPMYRQIVKISKGDESELHLFFPLLAECFVTLPLKQPDKLESALVLRIKEVPYIIMFTRPEFVELAPAASTFPYRVRMKVKDVCSHIAVKGAALALNPKHTNYSIPIIPRIFEKFFATLNLSPKPPPFRLPKRVRIPDLSNIQSSPTYDLGRLSFETALKEGGLYYVRNEDGTFSPLKMLKLDEKGVHIRQYSNSWPTPPPPGSFDESQLYMLGMDRKPGEKPGMGHLPISKQAFGGWNATFFQQSTVSDEELEGYKVWLNAKGGYF